MKVTIPDEDLKAILNGVTMLESASESDSICAITLGEWSQCD